VGGYKIDNFNHWPLIIPEVLADGTRSGMMSVDDKNKLDAMSGGYVRTILVDLTPAGFEVGASPTTILDWTSFDAKFESLSFFFVDESATAATFVLDTAEDTRYLDTPYETVVPGQSQRSVVLDNVRTWYRVRASALSGTITVNLRVTGA